MSEAGEVYSTYYRQVELHWSLARGNQIIVSPLEFASIESWYRTGVPLPVVLRAIDLFIEKKRKAKRKRSFLLTHADGTVQKCHKEYQVLREGEGEESNLLGSKMKGLVRKLTKLKREQADAAPIVESILTALKQVDLENIVQYEDVDKQLQDLDQQLVAWYLEHIPKEELAEIKAEVGELLEESEDPVFFAKLVNDSVRVQYQLPRLTLLG